MQHLRAHCSESLLILLKTDSNYSELITSYFCLLSRLGTAAFVIIIIRYKNNYTSTETYSTYDQRPSPLTPQKFRFLKENIIILCSALNSMPNSYIFQNFKQRKKNPTLLLEDNPLEVWNIHENARNKAIQSRASTSKAASTSSYCSNWVQEAGGFLENLTLYGFGHLTWMVTFYRQLNPNLERTWYFICFDT